MSIGKGFWYVLGVGLVGCVGFVVCGLAWLVTFFWAGSFAGWMGRACLIGLAVGVVGLGAVGLLIWRGVDRGVDR
jgi:hypothetical protein